MEQNVVKIKGLSSINAFANFVSVRNKSDPFLAGHAAVDSIFLNAALGVQFDGFDAIGEKVKVNIAN